MGNGNANEGLYKIYNVPAINYCYTCMYMKYEIIYHIKRTIPASGACIVLNIQVVYRTHGNADVSWRSCDIR